MTKPRLTARRSTILVLLLTFFVIPLALAVLPGCCPAIPPVPPRVTCPLPPEPRPVVLSPGSGDDGVTLTPAEAVSLGIYLRQETAWHTMAKTCLEAQP